MVPVTVRAVDVPQRSRRPGRTDLLLALVPALLGGAAAVLFAWLGTEDGPVLAVVALPFVVLTALPALWTRSAPLAAVVALGLATAVGYVVVALLRRSGVLPAPDGASVLLAVVVTSLVAALPAVHEVARHRDTPVLVAALAVVAAPFTVTSIYYSWRGGTSPPSLVFGSIMLFLVQVGLLAPAWGVGLVRGRRARREAERARHNAESAERAVRGERARIMRELQGLVLADLASIARQAERADRALAAGPGDPGARSDARAALLSVTATGRDTLTAMRRLLGMLRTTEPDGVQAPQPTLDRLDELVEANRRAGLEVRVTVFGQRRPLPDDVDLAAYRLLQRVLAGCGSAVPVRLQVSYADRALRLVARGDVGDGCGVAVREWARMVGGEVAADAGASTVEVWLPTHRGRAA